MNSSKKLTITLTLTFIFSAQIAQSQDLNLTYSNGNVSLPLNATNSMTIDPTTGDINVFTSNSAEQIGDALNLSCTGDAPSIALNRTVNGTTSANISWTLGNEPVFCEKSGQWSGILYGTPIVANNNQGVTVNGDYTLECFNAFGSNQATQTISNIAAAPTVALSVSPATVVSGGDVTVTWNLGNTPASCTKSGDWPTNGPMSASEITNGTHNEQVTNVTSSKSFTLECTNTAGTASDTVASNITGGGGSSWASCAPPSAAILNGAEDRSIIANGPLTPPGTYSGLFSGIQEAGSNNPWPGNIGENIGLALSKNRYIAAKFITNNIDYDMALQITGSSSNQGPQAQSWTYMISECPGAFDSPVNNQPACKTSGNSLRWSTKTTPTPGFPPGYFCRLEKNKTYYLNMVHSDNSEGNNYATSDCTSTSQSYCGILGQMIDVTL